MNKTPSILVDTGFEVDANGALTEIVFPKVVDTLNMPRKITVEGQTINWIPSNTTTLQEFSAPNITSLADNNLLKGYTALTTVTFASVKSITTTMGSGGQFYGCTSLTSVNMPALESMYTYAGQYGGTFVSCSALQSVTFPSLKEITTTAGSQFYRCTSLTDVTFPKLQSIITGGNEGTFYNCTSLVNVQFGSEGNPVSAIGSITFKGCTQSGLTITVYTNGGASLANEPWGATNAIIEYEEA